MRPTALGALVNGAGWLAILIGLLVGSLAPAIIGLLLIGGVMTTRWRLGRTPVQVHREMPERVAIGDRVSIVTEATAEHPMPMWVDDAIDAPLRLVSRDARPGFGHARTTTVATAAEAGTARWRTATVRLADPWAMHEEIRRIPAVDSLGVAPEADWLEQGRRAGRRNTVQTVVKGKRSFESTPQVDSVREYQPGDRMRDIDWARTARMNTLHARVREKVNPRPFLVLLDATASMRHQVRRAKVTSAARLAYGLIAAAHAAGVSARILAFDEHGQHDIPGRASEAMLRLSALDTPLPLSDVPAQKEILRATTREQRGFLGAVATLRRGGAPRAPPLDGALSRIAGAPHSLVVAILDGEVQPEATEHAVRKMKRDGHDVVLVIPATAAHHYDRHAGSTRLERLEEWATARNELEKRLRPVGVRVFSLRHDNVDAIIQEVAASGA